MENTHVMVGSINDSGILRGLHRKGFTPPKCLSELKANSIDADANNILYSITSSHIKIIDDGKGMKNEAIRNMFDMHKENHAGEKTRGVSGVGGKVSTMVLSEQKTVMMYTKSQDGPYYSITIPWDIMFKEGKYSEMIKVQNMTENEIIDFHK
jgi:signal transduction histidine kinase